MRYFVSIICSLVLFVFSYTTALADYDCAYGTSNGTNGWDENDRSLMVCFGGYNSPEEINGTVLQVDCLDNSNLLGGMCRDSDEDSITVDGYTSSSSWDTDPPAGFEGGHWYACRTFLDIPRAAGKLKVNITYPNGDKCSTSPIITQPKDWVITDGLPWSPAKQNNPITCWTNNKKGVNTALGCLVFESGNDLVTTILQISTGLAGGLALLLVLYGVYILTTSSGNPDKIKGGKEIITSAIVGLIFILLSVFLVNLIGINLLGIPGLT